MKIVPQATKKLISVLGIPRSGTTIVCNIFNSMANGFCLSEPYWTLLSNPKQLRFDKTGGLNFKTPDEIFNKILARLASDSKLNFAGLKETYRPKERRMKKHLAKMISSDVVVFVFREPKAHYNSFKVMAKHHKKNPMPLAYMIDTFNALYDETIAAHKNGNAAIIILEDLCKAGNQNAINYINQRSKGLIRIVGEFELKPTNYLYGNPKANRSKRIAPANTGTNLLTPEEASIINRELLPKYRALKNLSF